MTLALKTIIAFGLNESQPSCDMSSRLANWFSADPLGEVFVDPSTRTESIKCVFIPTNVIAATFTVSNYQ